MLDRSVYLNMNIDNRIPIDTQQEVLDNYMRKAQIELIKQAHPYAITAPKKENGRWQTYIKDSSKKSGRKEIKAPSEEALFQILAEYYLCGETFNEVYLQWIEYIKGYGKSGATIQRHEQRYEKYFSQSKIPNMAIKKIKLLELEAECNRIVSDFDLSYHEWQQVKTILLGTFKYAVKKSLIAENPMEKIEIGVRFRQVAKKASSTQVYNSDEYEELQAYLESQFAEEEDESFLAIMLGLYTGLRVGELSALQFGDIVGKKLHIVREEVQQKTKVNGKWLSKCIVVSHTKTNRDRYVSLLPKALNIIKKLREKHPNHQPDDYLFTRNGERLRDRQLAYVLEKFSERTGQQTKSTHKLRKTFASRLNANGVPLEHIRVELGHRYLTSTMDYIYNPLTDSETYDKMAGAI